MHNHDHELIAALAEGALDASQPTGAEAVLAGCPECLTELEAQRTALRALREAPRPTLTDLERVRLHRAVAGVLDIPPKPRSVRTIPWGIIAAAAAAVAGLALAGPILFGLDGPGEQGFAPAAQREAPTATTAAAADAESLSVAGFPEWIDLGEEDEEDLRLLFDHAARQGASSYTRQEASDLSSGLPAGPTDLTCHQESLALSDRNELLVLVGTATFEGRKSEVYLFTYASEDDSGAALDRAVLWVLEAGSSRILNTQEG
ncbi:MAG: hypothetical protein ACRDVL_06985 [Acidimicrobiia bacterium]